MKILVTGAKGFVGKNLVASLKNLKSFKDKTRPGLFIEDIYEYDINTNPNLLDTFCENADFVFHFAGVNRPKNTDEFMEGNFGLTDRRLERLKK